MIRIKRMIQPTINSISKTFMIMINSALKMLLIMRERRIATNN